MQHRLVCPFLPVDVQGTLGLGENVLARNCGEFPTNEIDGAYVDGSPISEVVVGVKQKIGLAMVGEIGSDQSFNILDEILLNRVKNHGIGFIEEVIIIISLFFVVIVEVVIFIGGADGKIGDALVEKSCLLNVLLADGEEITEVNVSCWVNPNGGEVLLNG